MVYTCMKEERVCAIRVSYRCNYGGRGELGYYQHVENIQTVHVEHLSSMLNRMRETIKYQAQTVLGKYNLVKVILVTKGQKTEICRIYNLKLLYRGTAGTKKRQKFAVTVAVASRTLVPVFKALFMARL